MNAARRSSRPWSIFLIACALLAACAPLPTRSLRASRGEIAEIALNPAPLPSSTGFAAVNATPEQRADTVDRVWRTIADFFYDPTFHGVDVQALRAKTLAESATVKSDAAFYRALKRNVRALHDSHTLISTPREAEDSRAFRATQIGLVFAISEGRVVIDRVVAGFPAAVAGARAGMILDAVDDQSIDEAFFARTRAAPPDPLGTEPASLGEADADRALRLRAVRALLAATDGKPRPHRMTLRRADDSLLTIDVEARGGDVPTRESYALLPSGIGVLRLSRFDSAVRGALARDIEAARLHSRGLILDLRANPGGEQRLFQWLVGRFLPRRIELMESLQRAGSRTVTGSIEADTGDRPYLAPIALLVDRSTASAAELTSHALVEQRDAIVVGEPTCGCVVAIRHDYVLPDGGALHVSQVGFRTVRGRRMEADPLLPTIAVVPTLAQRRADEDVVLEAAKRALLAR
jgi:carboxyl-terminal processing protease